VNPDLSFLLSVVFDSEPLAPAHLADLRKSGLSDETIARQMIRTVPPDLIDQLLGFPTPQVVSAYVIPFPNPHGGWMDHIRMKVFPAIEPGRGTIKYLQPRGSGVRLYFPLVTLDDVFHSDAELWCVEGEKKALAVAQVGLPAVGFCGVEGWHLTGSRALHPDFDDVGLRGRVVKLLPDSDVATNPAVARAVHRLGDALSARGATPLLVRLPVMA
jgi:hypothetical protein